MFLCCWPASSSSPYCLHTTNTSLGVRQEMKYSHFTSQLWEYCNLLHCILRVAKYHTECRLHLGHFDQISEYNQLSVEWVHWTVILTDPPHQYGNDRAQQQHCPGRRREGRTRTDRRIQNDISFVICVPSWAVRGVRWDGREKHLVCWC